MSDLTREEAIQVLQTALTSPFIYGKYADAIGMAIKVLMHDIRTETHGVCSDIISRADAIEAVAQQWLFEASVGNPYVNDDDIGEYRKLAEELFEDVPSADAVSREWYDDAVKANHELAFTDLPDIPRYYYEKVVGNMAHEINMLKEQLESADAVRREECDCVFSKPKIKLSKKAVEFNFSNIEVVVRCKDCRHAMVRTEEEMNKPIKPQPILCEWFCIGVENDDYCSHGERKE